MNTKQLEALANRVRNSATAASMGYGALGGGLLGGLGGAALGAFGPADEDERDPASRLRRALRNAMIGGGAGLAVGALGGGGYGRWLGNRMGSAIAPKPPAAAVAGQKQRGLELPIT